MNSDHFSKLIADTFQESINILNTKGAEYRNGSSNVLANFERGAELAGVHPLQIALIYLSKHYDALSSYIKAVSAGRTPKKLSEPIEGRIHDLINYLLFIKAIIYVYENTEPDPGGSFEEVVSKAFPPISSIHPS